MTVKLTPTTEIVLDMPIDVGGVSVDRLTMRIPRLKDRLAVDRMGRDLTDAEKEVRLFGNLMDLAPEEMEELTMVDYEKVQKAYTSFKGTKASKK